MQLATVFSGIGAPLDCLMLNHYSILNKYSTLDFSKFPSTKPNLILRSILIQHTSKNAVFIPDCYEGGVDGYVEMLFNTTLGG